MGTNVGPFDPNGDDAFIGDIPPGDSRFVGAALKQAYIDVIQPTPSDNGNVSFDPHVPNWYIDPATGTVATDISTQIRNQGRMGRSTASMDGAWSIYAQGTYESYEDFDHDPDFEGQGYTYLGYTNLLQGRHSLVFIEDLRDYVEHPGGNAAEDENSLRVWVTLHEIGHQFNLDDEGTTDGSHGVMELTPFRFPYFTAPQLRIVRRIGTPSNLE
jgi:hypothetical protein